MGGHTRDAAWVMTGLPEPRDESPYRVMLLTGSMRASSRAGIPA
jgi:hypothetical protein